MKKSRHTISDRALLRYLERAKGVDVEALRRELGRRVDSAVEGHVGLSAVNIAGLRFAIGRDGTVPTVWPSSATERHIGTYKRRREIE
ncbi:MAG: hypothetical protein ACRBB0_25565 [Pelagimonas sp.]|uniref:hypothetical protein n=1 Tax=Pelagimonas sp. TaxID=2073170 RepID=UPI003D6A1E41